MNSSRRNFLKSTAAAVAFSALAGRTPEAVAQEVKKEIYVACNQYAFSSYLWRDGIDAAKDVDKALEIMKANSIDGVELMFNQAEEIAPFAEKLKKHDLEMRTLYTSPNFHEKEVAEAEIKRVVDLGRAAKDHGIQIIVINMAVKSGKTDEELVLQSENTNRAGAELRKFGVALAFHYHTTELEFGGREFHHVMCGTQPENLTICFEMQWSYRASENSAVAVYDHLKLYGDRVSCIHLRQSKNGIWTETFGDGDIDNQRLVDGLQKLGKKPILTLEQAAEQGTEHTLTAAEVFRKSADYIHKTYAAIQ